MNLKNQILFDLTNNIISENKVFLHKHDGQSCYIFGNGASIKYFDLKYFSDKISIGCGPLFALRDFKKINLKYFLEAQPFFFYPYWTNPYTQQFEENHIGKYYKKNINKFENIDCFFSISNYFGISGRYFHYIHHFGEPFNGFDGCRLDERFTSMASGLACMLGIAIYMGFKNIYLVGCDYSFFPQSRGHFYEYGKWQDTYQEIPINFDFLNAASKHANVIIVTPDNTYKGHILNSITYEELTGDKPVYKENFEIVYSSDLAELDSARMSYKIYK